jgi:hypothetical protein
MSAMAILIDPPMWPAHGRLWSHLVSDVSFAELHAFARAHGVPPKGFEGDHYDVPQERYALLVAAGARPVPGRELLRRLRASGLRRPKRRGERVLASRPGPAGGRIDVLASALAPTGVVRAAHLVIPGRDGVLAVPDDDGGWALPRAQVPGPVAVPVGWRQVGYLRHHPDAGEGVELVLLRLPEHRDDGGYRLPRRPPARWVDPAAVARGPAAAARLLGPLLEAVLADHPS